MNDSKYDKKKLPTGLGWIIGAVFGIIIWAISYFILVEIGNIMGIILGLGGGTSLAISIESQNLSTLSIKQQHRLEWFFISGILILIIWVLILTYNILVG